MCKMKQKDKLKMIKAKEVEVITEDNEKVIGRLGVVKYKGKEYISYTLGIPEGIYGHIFSFDERERLYNGEELFIEGLSDAEDTFSAFVRFDERAAKIVIRDKKQ
ncbi:MAG: DUF3945 domain-containing protein [Eubacterium sp.]|nr:DUF3945 domain-containing protein [Eubacterium sp.]